MKPQNFIDSVLGPCAGAVFCLLSALYQADKMHPCWVAEGPLFDALS